METTTVFEFIVNGTTIKTTHEKLTALEIIGLAIKHGGLPGKADDYALELTNHERGFKPDDIVDLREYKDFVTEKSGSTPVAKERR